MGSQTNQDPAQENLVGNSCRKMLWDREEGEKANLRKAVIFRNVAFGIG